METVIIEKKQFDEMLNKMEKITSLLALNLVKDCKTQKDKILMLSSLGYGVTDISKLLNTTAGTVNQALVRARKEKSAKGSESEEMPAEDREKEQKEGEIVNEPK
jgi:DNA-directed RNA polymerase specialized sigma24 family protein